MPRARPNSDHESTPARPSGAARPRRPLRSPEERAARALGAAARQFAARGFAGVRMEDVAADLGIPKATLFSHFGSKDALFLEVYKTAASSLPAYLDAPDEVVSAGFFATLRYWLETTEHLVAEDWLPYRITLIGNHAVDLSLKRSINRWLAQTDPYGTAAFVRLGRDRGELRDDVDPATISALVDWVVERVQDALVTEELDAGLFRRPGAADDAIRTRLEEFLVLLGDAVGARTR